MTYGHIKTSQMTNREKNMSTIIKVYFPTIILIPFSLLFLLSHILLITRHHISHEQFFSLHVNYTKLISCKQSVGYMVKCKVQKKHMTLTIFHLTDLTDIIVLDWVYGCDAQHTYRHTSPNKWNKIHSTELNQIF